MKKSREGFTGQRLIRLPEATVKRARQLPVCRDVLATDLGHFPEAVRHEVRRAKGSRGHIVILCVSGEGWCRLNHGRRRTVPPRSLLVIPAGVPHEYGSSDRQPWRLYWVHFCGERAEDYLRLLGGEDSGAIRALSNVEELMEGFEMLWRLRDEGGSEPGLMRMSAELSRLLVQCHMRARGAGEGPQRAEARVERGLRRMREGLAEPLRLEEMARAAGVSVPHFCALFKAATGVAPVMYFTRMRMRHAAEWLDGTDEPVSAIAARVGYENPFHFTRAFRRTHGLSPSAYRKRVRG